MPTILVADDNSNIQKMVGIALKDQGIDVVAVGNGEAAVRKLSEHIPDLILADIFMPVRNGYEVCEYVKKDDRFAHIPVVLLVGAFDPLDEHEVERVHANGVLKKPFVPPDPLIELVKSLLKPAGAPPADTQKLEEEEDIQQTQDVMAPHISTGTIQVPRPTIPPVERTQRLEPVMPAPSRPGGTVEVARPPVPPADRTQPIEPFGGAEGFKLGLDEPATAPVVERTAQLSAKDISNILHRDSPLTGPKPEAEEEEFRVPPPVVDFQGEGGPVAFQDLLEPAESGESAAEEEPQGGGLGLAAFEAAAAEEGPSVAEIHFGGIREEAKTPDPELPPIPVAFDESEPLEIITEEHVESSGVHVAPAENLVSSHSGWASAGTGETHAPEPELVSEGSEGFMTPHRPAPAPPAPPSPIMMGIAREEEPVAAAAAPAPAIEPEAAKIAPEEFDETTDLPKGILQAEVSRAQEIAARIAAQNREFIASQEAAGIAAAAPAIDQTISAVDTLLAKHRGAPAIEEPVAAAAPAPEPMPEPVLAAPVVEIPAPAAAEAAPVRIPEPELAQQLIAPTVRVARPATSPDVMEMISDRVLSQLDPYLIEKITKEIVRPIVEAIIKRELEKLE